MLQADAILIANNVAIELRKVFGNALCDTFLYGSYARGDFTENSDIDILVTVNLSAEELSSYRRRIAAISSDLSLAHDVTVSITAKPFEQFTRYARVLPYYQNVLREGVRCAV